jgi:ATP synthase protein I
MAKPWLAIGRYGSVGLELVLTILIVAALGQWLDARYWGGHGWGGAGGFLLGVAVAFRNLVRTANKMQADIERAEARDPEAGKWRVDEGWLHPQDDGRSSEPRDDAESRRDADHDEER